MSTTAGWVVALVATAFLSSILGGIVVLLLNAWLNKPEVVVVERQAEIKEESSVMFTAEDEAAFWSGNR